MFLEMSTLYKAINTFINNKKIKSMTSVTKKNTWIYDHKYKSMKYNTNLNTKLHKSFYLATHNFHIFNKKYYLLKNNYFRNTLNDPYLFKLDELESLDVDTEEDFNFVKKVYKGNY